MKISNLKPVQVLAQLPLYRDAFREQMWVAATDHKFLETRPWTLLYVCNSLNLRGHCILHVGIRNEGIILTSRHDI